MKVNVTVTRKTTLTREVEMPADQYEELQAKLARYGHARHVAEDEINALMDGNRDWSDDELLDVEEFEPSIGV